MTNDQLILYRSLSFILGLAVIVYLIAGYMSIFVICEHCKKNKNILYIITICFFWPLFLSCKSINSIYKYLKKNKNEEKI